MPSSTRKTSRASSARSSLSNKLPPQIKAEIIRISISHSYDTAILEAFAKFVAANPKPPKPLSMDQLKQAVYKHFGVQSTPALKKLGSFQMATDGMENLNMAQKNTWERLYREFVGVLPGEEYEEGKDCINGVNIFKYFLPWKILGIEPTLDTDRVKAAYRELAKIYHPDNLETGDSRIFQRLHVIYQSLIAEP